MRRLIDRQAPRLNVEVLESRITPSTVTALPVDSVCAKAVVASTVAGNNLIVTTSNSEGGGLGMAAAKGSTRLPYSYSVTGNAGDVGAFPAALPPTSSGLALMGGGTNVDEVFRWMGAKAAGGDFLVIRAVGTAAYNKYIDGLVPSLDSVATLVIPDRAAANNPDVARVIRQAEAIFIAGGDQSDYVNFWNDTPVEDAIYEAILHNIPVGGTSAGLAVLGDVDFTGTAGSITSSEALVNPLDSRIVAGLDSRFVTPEDAPSGTILQYLDNVITDSHFMQRDRMGRLLTFMADMDAQNMVPNLPRGIAVNEQTALLIEADGQAQVVGNPYLGKKLSPTEQQRSVYLLQGITANPLVAANVALEYGVHVLRANYDPTILSGDTFDLDDLFGSADWSLTGLDRYDVLAANGGVSTNDPSGLIYGQV